MEVEGNGEVDFSVCLEQQTRNRRLLTTFQIRDVTGMLNG